MIKNTMSLKAKINNIAKKEMDMDTTIKGFELDSKNLRNILDGIISIKIDVTTGDKITYKEINYKYNLLLENRSINIWTYNVETIIAEKYESIIKRSILNTRIRDFYDLYMLSIWTIKIFQIKY